MPAVLDVRLESLDDAATFVDALSHSDVGELVFSLGHDAVGGIYVECGRICWVAAKGRGRHLSDQLATAAGVDRSVLARHFARCQESKVPLGEDLVARGIVTSDALREALLLHSAECLDMLCRPDLASRWHPRLRGYRSAFTFSTTELVARAYALRSTQAAAAASRVLEEHFSAGAGDWGAAFFSFAELGAARPVAVVGAFPEKFGDLISDAQLTAMATAPASVAAGQLVQLAFDGDRARCLFHRGDCTFVGSMSAEAARQLTSPPRNRR